MKNCYIYTRVSTAVQVDGFSLDAQMKALRDYAEYRELRIAGEYCDAGRSGKTIKDRPEFRQMMDDVRSQKDEVEFILVFKLSRFGRNAADILRSLQVLEDYDVNLVSVNEAIDSSTKGGKLTLTMLSAVAEMEHENITVQFMAAKKQRILNGNWSGGTVPFGYRAANRHLVKDEYEAEVIRKIYELYLMEENSASSVAGLMNESDYELTNRKEGKPIPFTYEFVTRMVSSPLYCGKVLYNRKTNRKDHDGKTLKQNPEDLITVDGNHEPIVTEEQWMLAQEKKKRLGQKYKKSRLQVNDNILAGIVKCPVCGKGLIGYTSKRKKTDGKEYYPLISYYVCRYHRKSSGGSCSFCRPLHQDAVDGTVFEIMKRLQFNDQFRKELEKAMGTEGSLEERKQNLKYLRIELKDAESAKEKLGTQLDSLNPLRDDYDDNYDLISDKLDEAYDRIDELEKAIRAEKKVLASLEKRSESLGNLDEFLSNLGSLIEKMTSKEKKELCKTLIEKVEIYPEERDDGRIVKSVTFKFPVDFEGLETIEKAGDVVSFTLDCEAIDLPLPEVKKKPTYTAIRSYVKETFGCHVSSLNIAQTKRKYGIDMGKAYNKPEQPKSKIPNCTPEKERMILDALKHFGVLDQSIEYKEGDNHDKN